MSEIRYWYQPKSPWIEIMETEQNPCGCCKNLVNVKRKHWPYNPSKGNDHYCFYLAKEADVYFYLADYGWEELK